MKPKFSIANDHLILKTTNGEDSYKLPHPAKELVGVTTWLNDLNRRAQKIANLKTSMVSMNSHNVFFYRGEVEIRVKIPSVKQKQILVRPDTHLMVKEQAAKAKLPMMDYIHLCVVNAKSDRKDI